MTRSRFVPASLLLLSLSLVAPIVAHADTTSAAAARVFWRDGAKKYSLGKFEEAVQLFELAYEKHAYADILYNLAQAHRQLKHHERAIFYYQSYLRGVPTATNRDLVESFVKELQQVMREQEIATTRPPTSAKQPGESRLSAEPIATGERWYHDKWAWTASSVGAALAGVGTWALLSASSLRADALDTDEVTRMRLRGQADDRDALGVPLVIGGIVGIGVGVVLFAIVGDPSPAVPTVSITPDGTATLVWSGHF